jgi:hypothetical protein
MAVWEKDYIGKHEGSDTVAEEATDVLDITIGKALMMY